MECQNTLPALHSNGEDVIIEEFITGIFYSSPIITRNGTTVVLPPVREESTPPAFLEYWIANPLSIMSKDVLSG